MTYYLDASAAVKLVKPESETPALVKFLESRPAGFISSDLLRTELMGTLQRAGLPPAEGLRVLSAVVLFRLSPQISETAGALVGRLNIRSLDALHLATAISWQTQLSGILTYDHKLAEAAANLGLQFESPR